jgi:stringent starvation protein B
MTGHGCDYCVQGARMTRRAKKEKKILLNCTIPVTGWLVLVTARLTFRGAGAGGYGTVQAPVIKGRTVPARKKGDTAMDEFPIPDPHHKMAIIMESNSPKQPDGN